MMIEWHTSTIPGFPSFDGPKWFPGEPVPRPDQPEQAGRGQKIRILVIDDEVLIAETVAEILHAEGFETTAVSNGASAIELAEKVRPDIVLSDVIMPGLNGIETGIRIREIVPHCQLVLFSGQAATVDLLAKARAEGHRFEILAKPIKPEQLISVIRRMSNPLS